ncbi:hypothetical protein [Actinacidiphila acidipaludis]|uniref:Uncharacterized protein n=1 Tax=Actinacidiphila acidipaludis TaxID=2873382 RepID=A0ABS7QCY5_9ACTN|nr:hypothetical protein [Streptomyces acidipaludis]MBY8881021.1 hypothetical protein [Streptomyces acidipaludis]
MRNQVRGSRGERTDSSFGEGQGPELTLSARIVGVDTDTDTDAEDAFDDDLGEAVRLACPDCARPIAVLPDEDRLPEHALCPTPWNPFGLTVCGGSGRPVAEARPLDDGADGDEPEFAVLLALPAGLDWRTQPFSHVGGPGSRPLRARATGLAA